MERSWLSHCERIVVKVGTRVVVHPEGHANGEVLLPLSRQIAHLRRDGCQVVLVSSGAVGLGRASSRGKWEETLSHKQALAAIGQVELMNVYKRIFELLNVPVAQVLLTRDDLNARERYLNARNALNSLLSAGVLPIINENDSVSIEEIKFGDNDILASLVGGLVDADVVVNLTQTPGLLAPDPKRPGAQQVVDRVRQVDEELYRWVNPTLSAGGTGGMASKLEAARAALDYGIGMVIAAASEPEVLVRLLQGEMLGTLFLDDRRRLTGKKRWLAASENCRGRIKVDEGAARALTGQGKSLLAVGVVEAAGHFRVGDLVAVCGPDDRELGRGLINLDSDELGRQLAELQSRKRADEASPIGRGWPEVIHRDNLLIHRHPRKTAPTRGREAREL